MKRKRVQKQYFRFIPLSFFVIIAILFLQASSSPNHPGKFQIQDQATPTPSSNITMRGTVMDENGQPLHTFISINSGLYEPLGNVMSDYDGNYTIQVPYRKGYIVNAQETDGRATFGNAVIPTGYLDQDKVVMSDSLNDLVVDFTLQAAGAIWLTTYDLDGNYLFRQDVNNNDWLTAIYPLGEPPTARPLQYINHQTNTFWGWENGSDKNHTVLLIPPEKPVEIWIDYHVPDVGNTFIHLNNDGKGYSVQKGGVLQIIFLEDAAKTEYRLYAQRIVDYLSGGYTLSKDITDWSTEGIQLIETMSENCATKNYGECINLANKVLTQTIRSREDAILQVAQQDIEKFRKKDVKFEVTNCDGAPLTNTEVNFEQKTQDFIYGVGWPEDNQLDILKNAGFNGGIEEAWWGEVLSADGTYDFHDDRFEPLTRRGMDIVMHTGVWITPITNPDWYFVPRSIFNMTPAEIADLAGEFSEKMTGHYRDQMSIYDVYNEPQNAFQTMHFTLDDVVNIAAASAEGAERGAPEVPTYINLYFAYLGKDLSWVPNAYNQDYPPPEEILQAIIKDDVPFDNIGLEFYNDPSLDFGIYDDTIEYYSHFEKSVFVSELSYSGNWRDETSDQAAAEWAKYAYTIAFSKPYVTGVVWIPGDNPGWPGYFFNTDGSTRPVVDAIGSLIHSWTTTGSGMTNEKGELTFHGFAGQYEIRWLDQAGSEQVSTIQVSQNTQNDFLLKPSSCQSITPLTTNGTITSPSSTTNTQVEEENRFPFLNVGILTVFVLLVIGFLFWRRRTKKKS